MKKTILLLGLVLLSAAAFAQRANELDLQLSRIDTSSVTSGIIYERVFASYLT